MFKYPQVTSFKNINQILKKNDKNYSPEKTFKAITSTEDFMPNKSNLLISENSINNNNSNSNNISTPNNPFSSNTNSNTFSIASQKCATPNQLHSFHSRSSHPLGTKTPSNNLIGFFNKICLLQGKNILTFDVLT